MPGYAVPGNFCAINPKHQSGRGPFVYVPPSGFAVFPELGKTKQTVTFSRMLIHSSLSDRLLIIKCLDLDKCGPLNSAVVGETAAVSNLPPDVATITAKYGTLTMYNV